MTAGPASPKADSNRSATTVTAHEQSSDQITSMPTADNTTNANVNAKDAVLEATTLNGDDPLDLIRHKRPDVSQRQMKVDHPKADKRRMKKFYTRQNALIDQFLQSGDEERLAAIDTMENGPKVKFAVNASFIVNFCLFIIQMYAAISTGSLSLFATAADAFMDLVSSVVMLVTSRMAARPSVYKYPVGRTRIETIGIIMFCCLMTTVAIQLIVGLAMYICITPWLNQVRSNLGVPWEVGRKMRSPFISFLSSSLPLQVSILEVSSIQVC